ncbi:hypothetical protein KM176_20835 [Pseudooceanicola sp. CBS1P-1]|uniref:AraC family transcriptional regulator n=1 Tax=Pseudooceanicola albus TaxID=2692189 RepID=A0A6L7G9W1_9RHOB|nr:MULTISPECIES: hypothetical protein [Pseudooceanicola]MBT9386328.1 hypothetical protein [Pseudooceanicola endophyticus]MXN20377.1 hypothetical protein [Pseudooceanicola albus]
MTVTGEGTYNIGRAFGLPAAPVLSIVPTGGAALTACLLEIPAPGPQGRPVVLPPADAHFLMLYLDAAEHAEIDADGVQGALRHVPARAICLIDLEEGASILLGHPLRAVAFVCPRPVLRDVARLAGTGEGTLRCLHGTSDPVVADLATALVPLFGAPAASRALLRHVAMALCAHLVHSHGAWP